MIVSSIEFDTCSGPVEMDIGHRMYPEVFSEFPDLKDTLNLCNIGALIVRIGFWGPFYYNENMEPSK